MRTLLLAALLISAAATASTPGVPPWIVSNNKQSTPLFEAGYLDATLYDGWQGHRVDPSGVLDSTAALQQAINDARDYNLVTFLPAGTYKISNTLTGESLDGSGRNVNCLNHTQYGTGFSAPQAATLVGPSSGPRPKLVLAPNASGFGDATKPKAVVHFWLQDVNAKGWQGDPGCLMWGAIRDLELDLGGNAGAVGIQFAAAQYSSLEDIKVDATGAYAGIEGTPTTNPVVNVEVEGGQYGIIPATCCGITLAGITVKNQTVAGLLVNNFEPVMVTGFDIEETHAVAVLNTAYAAQMSELGLLDGTIVVNGATTPAISNPDGHSLWVSNVYVKTTGSLVQSGTETPIAASGQTDLIQEYLFTNSKSSTNAGFTVLGSVHLIDGTQGTGELVTVKLHSSAAPRDLVSRHLPGPIPWAFDSTTLNVKKMGALGDGVHDDTAAIQAAINQSDAVFIPRGDFQLTATLQLKANTRLFGLPGARSRLRGTHFDPAGTFKPFVETVDSAAAKNYLGDLEFALPEPASSTYLNAIEWRAGRASVMNQISVDLPWEASDFASQPRKIIHVSGHGGGKFFGVTTPGDGRSGNAGFRLMLIDGTTAPITVYQPNPEHAGGSVEWEISNAANVRILGLKSETGNLLKIAGSHNVQFAGHAGHDYVSPSESSVEVVDSHDVELPLLSLYEGNVTAAGRAGYQISYSNNGSALTGVRASYDVSLFREGTFDPTVFSHCGDGTCDRSESSASCPGDCSGSGSGAGGGAGGGGGSGTGGGGGTNANTWTACQLATAIQVDGSATDWASVPALSLPHTSAKILADAPQLPSSDADLSAKVQLAWDSTNLYALVTVTDDTIEDPASVILPYVDGVELYLDGTHSRASSYGAGDFQLTVSQSGRYDSAVATKAKFAHATARTSNGYRVEYAIPWASLGPRLGTIGFDVAVNDDDNGNARQSQLVWAGDGTAWKDPRQFGDLTISSAACGSAGLSSPLDREDQNGAGVTGGCSSIGGGTWALLALALALTSWSGRRRSAASCPAAPAPERCG